MEREYAFRIGLIRGFSSSSLAGSAMSDGCVMRISVMISMAIVCRAGSTLSKQRKKSVRFSSARFYDVVSD